MHCVKKVATVEAASFQSEKAHNKTTMALEGDLVSLKLVTTNSHGVLVEEFTERLQKQQTMASALDRVIVIQAKVDGKND